MVKVVTNTENKKSQSIISLQFLLRVGELPIDVVDQLRFDETREWIEQLLLLEQLLAECKDVLVDALYEAVGKYKEDKQLRHALIKIKRDVFNQRIPTNLTKISEVARALTFPERELLIECVKLWSRYSSLHSRIQEIFTSELCRKRTQLKQMIEIPNFRNSLLLSSPLPDKAIDSYLASDGHTLNRKTRTVEHAVIEYLQCAACKTSPFSTSTSVCSGLFDSANTKYEKGIAPSLSQPIEDKALNLQRLTINEIVRHEVSSDVAEFQRLLPAFDMNLPHRLMTKGYFQSRYGVGQRCDDFLSFAYSFQQVLFAQYTSNIPDADQSACRVNHFKQPEIEQLNNARQAIADYLREAYHRLPPKSQELQLTDDFITAIACHIPKNTGHLFSHAFFTQFTGVEAEPLLIINHIYSGLTLTFSQFARVFREERGYHLASELRATLERLQPPGAVFAELKGGCDNSNLSPQVTKYELVCPGDRSLRPANEQIPLQDLYIQDNEREGTLYLHSKRLGKEVIPLYLGFLHPTALPEIQQVLLNFSYSMRCSLDLWKGTRIANVEEPMVYRPRIRYKHLVLQRAHWTILPSTFPQRASSRSDADFLLSITRWRQTCGIPPRAFVTFETSGHKPLYVDFENYFSVALLEASLRSCTHRLQINEMLPHRDHLWLKHNGQSYVSEFVWEMHSLEDGYDDKELDRMPIFYTSNPNPTESTTTL